MQTPRIRPQPKFTAHLVSSGVFRSAPFCLADVGSSGGIDSYWNSFAPDLNAFGFDPLIREVERLNSQTTGENIRYFPYLVGYRDYDQVFPPSLRNQVPDNRVDQRTSARRAEGILACDYVKTYFDQTGSGEYATDLIELDDFFMKTCPSNIDFIKIDTDGSDYQVLLGARKLLSAANVMGVGIESQFHGLLHDQSNTFSNLDRLLREEGFSLFDLEVYRYARGAMPKPFMYKVPAQTVEGQVLWGDALYLRDAGSDTYEKTWQRSFDVLKILKLACLFEMFGMEDCAAELILKYKPSLESTVDVEACLDLLTPAFGDDRLSYRRYLQEFDRRPGAFFPAGEAKP